MADQAPFLDYTNRDYPSLVNAMLDLAAQRLPEWTDRSENDLGRLLIELFAHVGDVILYYQDRIANELFLSTAVERRSVIDLLRLIGYTLATPMPALAELSVLDPVARVEVRPGARFTTVVKPDQPARRFVFLPADDQPLVLVSGALGLPRIPVLQADVISETLTVPEDVLGPLRLRLAERPVVVPRRADTNPHYLVVQVGRDDVWVRWTRRDSLLDSGKDGRHYTVEVDDEDRAWLLFGDGQIGERPAAGTQVRIRYLKTDGAAGNVGARAISKLIDGASPSVRVSNPAPASGGADRESIENARLVAPRLLRSQRRAVTAADYQALALSDPSVLQARAVGGGFGHVRVYVVAKGGVAAEDELKGRLQVLFEQHRPLTSTVSVHDPVFVTLSINVAIGIEGGFSEVDVSTRVRAALAALTALAGRSFGQIFYVSKVYEVVEAVEGVAYAMVNVPVGVGYKDGQEVPTLPGPSGSVPIAAARDGLIRLYPDQFPDFFIPDPTQDAP